MCSEKQRKRIQAASKRAGKSVPSTAFLEELSVKAIDVLIKELKEAGAWEYNGEGGSEKVKKTDFNPQAFGMCFKLEYRKNVDLHRAVSGFGFTEDVIKLYETYLKTKQRAEFKEVS